MEKTRNYEMFKYLDANRDKSNGLSLSHIRRLKQSIMDRNMLELRPICVTENMEVIDGQHRLEVAKQLGVDIYYVVKKDFKPKDLIDLNVAKTWSASDYLNFYCKEGNQE